MAKTEKDDYIGELESRLGEWKGEIAELRSRAGEVAAAARKPYLEQIDDLRKRRKYLAERLRELGEASGGAWEDMRAGIDRASETLREAIQAAKSSFSASPARKK